jgi:hypothetical protein
MTATEWRSGMRTERCRRTCPQNRRSRWSIRPTVSTRARGFEYPQRDGQRPFVGASAWAARVKACATPALARRWSRALAASGQVLHKPRGRKPRRTPRWSSSAAAMAIGLRWRRNRGACDASSRPLRRARVACGAPSRGSSGLQRGIQRLRSCFARSNPQDAVFGVELIGCDRDGS